MWLINPSTAFPDPWFRLIWLLELIALLLLILTALRFSRRAWIGSSVLFGLALVAIVPGWVYRLTHPEPIGAMIDIPLLLMFPIIAVSFVWAIVAWMIRLLRQRRRVV
ncbi:hypothetical protein [Paenibacillus campi]|uniref:hypothetical protein n=1 Tax=Paenibacillus campi TaxID=3106031 RepID=UPI002B000139|nr:MULTISPECIES: hypothetical protein [unclassified Paenibacillus]